MLKRKNLILIILSVLLILLSACGESIETNMSEEVAEFSFTTQDEEKLSLDDLKGDWTIAYFMYTNCTIVCPTTTPNMVSVQQQLKDDDLNPQIISFSIDPEYDTPDVLKEYANEYGADLEYWHFLTGYDFKDIQTVSEQSFKSALEDGGPDSHQYVHSTNFFLINPKGEIIKSYDGMSFKETNLLVEDLKEVM